MIYHYSVAPLNSKFNFMDCQSIVSSILKALKVVLTARVSIMWSTYTVLIRHKSEVQVLT